MLLNTSKLDIINSFSGHIWPYFGCMHKVCMRTQKHFSLRAFRLNLFLWMWTSQNKIPIFIRNMTWYEGTTFTSHSTKLVAAWTRNCISRKKEIKVIITIKFFHVHRGSIDQNLSPSMTKEPYDWLFFFCKQPPPLDSLITAKEEGDASAKFNTYTNNRFLVYLRGLS